MKFTFKKDAQMTGLAGVGNPRPDTRIKMNKQEIGCISAPNWQSKDDKWTVRFTVTKEATKEDPCEWKWVTVSKRFDSEPEARLFVKANLETVLSKNKLTLHLFPFPEDG